MDYVANYMTTAVDPREWARQREAEGWKVLGCADHLFSAERAWPHLWVSLAAMAGATTSVLLTSSFANNLLRSPVEVAQAALQMAQVSDGRFELGLGAGWSQIELDGAGLEFPSPGVRATRYAEAFRIVRDLVRTGSATFSGEHYSVNVPHLGPRHDVPLVASVGGARTIREVAPLADRIELKAMSSATRGGSLDVAGMRAIDDASVSDLVDRARIANPTAPLGLFVLCSVGSDVRTNAVADALTGSLFGSFFGSDAGRVAEAIRNLDRFGLDRIQLSPLHDSAWPELAQALFGD